MHESRTTPPEVMIEQHAPHEMVLNAAELKHRVAARLRENPYFRVLADALAPLDSDTKTRIGTRIEALGGGDRNGSQRDYMPFIAETQADPTREFLWQQVIARSNDAYLRHFESEVREGRNYIPQIVVGSGPNGSIIAMEMLARSDNPGTLVADKGANMGGRFASNEPLFTLNSPTDPHDGNGEPWMHQTAPDGATQPQDWLGESAVVQQDDITDSPHASQNMLSRSIKFNHLALGVPRVMGCEIKSLQATNASADHASASFVVDIDIGGEVYTVLTDRVIFAPGQGEQKTELAGSRDEGKMKTQEIIEGGQIEYEKYGAARTMTAEQALVSVRSQPEYFQDKRIIVVGDGDTAKSVLLALRTARLTSGTDQKVYWVGQRAGTRDGFLEDELSVYHPIAEDLPEHDGERDTIFTPIPQKAYYLDRAKSDDPSALAVLLSDNSRSGVNGDIVILAHGFKGFDIHDLIPEVRADDLELVTAPVPTQSDKAPVAKKVPGAEIYITGAGADLPMTPLETDILQAASLQGKKRFPYSIARLGTLARALAQHLPPLPENSIAQSARLSDVFPEPLPSPAAPSTPQESWAQDVEIPAGVKGADVLPFAIGAAWTPFQLADDISSVTFRVERGAPDETRSLQVQVEGILFSDGRSQAVNELSEFQNSDPVTALEHDTLFQSACRRLLEERGNDEFTLTIPLVKGKVNVKQIALS